MERGVVTLYHHGTMYVLYPMTMMRHSQRDTYIRLVYIPTFRSPIPYIADKGFQSKAHLFSKGVPWVGNNNAACSTISEIGVDQE